MNDFISGLKIVINPEFLGVLLGVVILLSILYLLMNFIYKIGLKNDTN